MNSNVVKRIKPNRVKTGVPKRAPKQTDYPTMSKGSHIASDLRAKANNLSEEERASLSDLGKELIYGGKRSKETTRSRH